MFKLKNEYKLELKTPEPIKMFGSTKKVIDKIESRQEVPTLEVSEVVLVQCNLLDNQYQQNSEVL